MKALKRLGIGLLALILVAYAAFAVIGRIAEDKVNKQIAAIKTSGAPVSIADLARNISAKENAAPLYLQAFKMISEPGVGKQVNECCDFLSRDASAREPRLNDALAISKRCSKIIPVLDTAASRSICRYPGSRSDDPTDIFFPNFQGMRRLTKFLAATALADAMDGNVEGSLHRSLLAFKVEESLKDQPAMIGFLLRDACLAIASRGLNESLKNEEIDEGQARRMYDELGRIDLCAGYRSSMEGERVFGLNAMKMNRESGGMIIDEEGREPGAWEKVVKSTSFGRWRAYADESFYIERMNKIVGCSRIPYLEIKKKRMDRIASVPWYAANTVMVLPIFESAGLIRDRCVAEIAGDRVLLAIMAYRSRFRSYPESLDDLRKKLKWELPIDPFSVSDFKYRREGKGFLLYSIGPNLVDDGGKAPEPRGDLMKKGDMVWKWDR